MNRDDLLNELTHLARQQGWIIGYCEGVDKTIDECEKLIEAFFDCHTNNEMYQALEAVRKKVKG